MELFPALEMGWLNGWILLVLLYLIFGVLLIIFPKDVVARLYEYDRSRLSKWQKAFNVIRESLGVVCLVLIIFTPMKIGTPFFIPGIVLFILGLAGFSVALFDFKNRPLDKPVVRGLYRISRHPQILMIFISVCGIGIAIGSWTVLFMQILASLFGHSRIMVEEQACLKLYGDLYRAYMKCVPRYFLFF